MKRGQRSPVAKKKRPNLSIPSETKPKTHWNFSNLVFVYLMVWLDWIVASHSQTGTENGGAAETDGTADIGRVSGRAERRR